MTSCPPPLPIVRAVAHGAVACATIAIVAAIWSWMPGGRSEVLALATVGGFGVLTWCGAMLAPRSASHYAANDNDPIVVPVSRFDWQLVTDPEVARTALLR